VVDGIAGGILEGLKDNFDTDKCLEKYPIVYSESMNTVLVQEMQRFNRVLTVMRRTLINLRKALKGLVVMNAELDNVGANLAVGKVPASWMKASYPSLKPLGSYVKDLYKRLDFFQQWYESGKPGCFWLPGFYFNQAFLTGALQNYARKYTIPIDSITFDFEVLKEKPPHDGKGPEDGVWCYGMYLDGARWDKSNHKLAEARPKKLFNDMAYCHFKPAKAVDVDGSDRYLCPCYKTSDRRGVLSTTGLSTNFVIGILVDTDLSDDHWIRRGLAMLLSLDD